MGLLVVVRNNAREPKYRCLCCNDAVFFDGEERAYETHVVLCANRNDEELRGESWRVKAPGIFDPNVSGDVELDKWIRKHRALLLEDRLKL